MVGKVLREAAPVHALPWHQVLRSSGHLAFDAQSCRAQQQTRRLIAEGIAVVGNRVKLKHVIWRPELHDILSMTF